MLFPQPCRSLSPDWPSQLKRTAGRSSSTLDLFASGLPGLVVRGKCRCLGYATSALQVSTGKGACSLRCTASPACQLGMREALLSD